MEAAKWLMLSAQQGYAPAQTNLAVCYATGAGMEKDQAQAIAWIRKLPTKAMLATLHKAKKAVTNETTGVGRRARFGLRAVDLRERGVLLQGHHRMRGSTNHMHVLLSSFSKPEFSGTNMYAPMIWFALFGKGRVVTTSMGHIMSADTTHNALHRWSSSKRLDVRV
jgi:hypothetical protein